MPTVLECAQMCKAVYDPDPVFEGWVLHDVQTSGSGLLDAFQGAAFKKNDEVVYAFKGTSQKRDWAADLKLGMGMSTAQYSSAAQFLKKTPIATGTYIYLTGHSLGGAIAQVMGNRKKLPFVTFNAPGVGLASRNLDQMAVGAVTPLGHLRWIGSLASTVRHPQQAWEDLTAVGYRVQGVNFRLGKDAVGCIGIHFGNVIEIPYSGGALDVGNKHSIDTVISALEKSPHGQTLIDTHLN